ncbi:MAG: DUF3192 domain-containing protein [Candidatus Omnitrophica bacterium]|nr:DUF3192 domain-containing protein [Candidatus Omnitrophota bacterium]
MNRLILLFLLAVVSGGCAAGMYNPVTASTSSQTFLMNEASFAQVKVGMAQDKVEQIMGGSIVIGYAYQKPLTDEAAIAKAVSEDYKPLTIANPYKTEDIKTKEGSYHVEYYISSIRQSDGVVSDDELVPLVFREGILVARGWDYVRSLRLKNPS